MFLDQVRLLQLTVRLQVLIVHLNLTPYAYTCNAQQHYLRQGLGLG